MSVTIHTGDCCDLMRLLPDASVDSVVTDPPYGIRFMGKAWDGADIDARHAKRAAAASQDPSCTERGAHKSIAAEAGKYDLTPAEMIAFQTFSQQWAREAFRVLKPGGYLLAFASPRTYHRMACGVEAAGFEVRDQIQWLFGSGFPKSHNGPWGGTALKPAYEPIVMARKPLIGTVAENFAVHGTGALNIDACRVPTSDPLGGGDEQLTPRERSDGWARPWMQDPDATDAHAAKMRGNVEKAEKLGRWPANVIHDGSDCVVDQFPAQAGAAATVHRRNGDKFRSTFGAFQGNVDEAGSTFQGDSGSAARFFYCAKADRADRNAGLEGIQPPAVAHDATPRDIENANWPARNGNHHPTVKPTDLMRYLCRLVTPAGGLVLDPFMGSGSTGRGAIAEGFRFIGIELDPEYVEIARLRINAMQPGLSLGVPA